MLEEYSFKMLRFVKELQEFHSCVYNTANKIK